jgi:adenine-specific DNA-methyltransferase
LKEWDINIYRGILTGYNEAFIITQETRDILVEASSKNAEIIRPILLGKNIKRYKYEWDGLWIIFTRRGIQIDDYPDVKEHLLKYYDQLKPRNNGELTGRKPGSYEWFHIQDNVAYFQDFEKPKIVWGNLALRSQFSFVKENYYINAPSAFIATENYYLLAVLNSKIADYYIKQLGVSRNGGYFEYKPMFVQQLPIPNVAENEQKQFQLIIEKLLHERAENRNTADLEIRIDEMIYELYDLSNEEAAFLNSI